MATGFRVAAGVAPSAAHQSSLERLEVDGEAIMVPERCAADPRLMIGLPFDSGANAQGGWGAMAHSKRGSRSWAEAR